MAAIVQLELDEDAANEVRELAEILHKTPQQIASEIFAEGMHRRRREAFYRKHAGTVSAEEGLAILRSMGKGVPPDPGDELPDDLKYLLDDRRG